MVTRRSRSNSAQSAPKNALVGGDKPVSFATRASGGASAEATQYSRDSGNYGKGGRDGKRKSVNHSRGRMSKGTKTGIIVLLVLLAILIGSVLGFYKFISSVNDELVGGKSEEELLAIQDSLVARARLRSLRKPSWLLGCSCKFSRLLGKRTVPPKAPPETVITY